MTLGARRIPLVLVVVALGIGAHVPLAAASDARPVVASAAPATSVIVSFAPGAAPSLVTRSLAVAGAPGHDRPAASGDVVMFASGAGFAARLDDATVAVLRAQPWITAVTPNRVLAPASAPHLTRIGAPTVWAGGHRGEGETIAVVDTGVDTTNPNLAGVVAAEACFTPPRGAGGGDCPDGSTTQVGPGAGVPCTGRNDCAHGTHVASVAAGVGPAVLGVAPGASLLSVRVFSSVRTPDERVITDEASLVRALEWVERVAATRPVAAVNLSLGGPPLATPCTASPALLAVIDRLVAAGTAVVASAGNDGASSMLSFPACIPGVIAVAAEGAPGARASFTNTAPQAVLYAPGEAVEGAWSDPCCTRVVSGTSFAAPQVAAAFALLHQAFGRGEVAGRAELLRRTGDPVRDAGAGSTAGASAIRLGRALDPQYASTTPAALARPSSPIGVIDGFTTEPGGFRTWGWALDPDNVEPVVVHAYVDGVFTATTTAASSRPDVAAAHPGYGASHGFDVRVDVPIGVHELCVYALDVGPGSGNVLLGCRRADLGAATGFLDLVALDGDVLRVAGWAIDTATGAPTRVALVVDDVEVVTGVAAFDRPDVAAVAPAYGAAHGYWLQTAAPAPGTHRVCARTTGSDGRVVTLGCRDLDVPAAR